jgi:hypothetical protein
VKLVAVTSGFSADETEGEVAARVQVKRGPASSGRSSKQVFVPRKVSAPDYAAIGTLQLGRRRCTRA